MFYYINQIINAGYYTSALVCWGLIFAAVSKEGVSLGDLVRLRFAQSLSADQKILAELVLDLAKAVREAKQSLEEALQAAEAITPEVRQQSVTCGSVTVNAEIPAAEVIETNIKSGQDALRRAKTALTRRGVKIDRSMGKPIFYGSKDYPGLLVREVNGFKTLGKFSGGRFRIVKIDDD